MTEPTLLVADDHPLFRAAVLHVLQGRLPQFRTLEAASAATLGQALQEHPEIELVLLDLSMPGARGFSALLHVRGEYPEVPVVIISSNDHPRVIRRAQQFGAAGFKTATAEYQPSRGDGGAFRSTKARPTLRDMSSLPCARPSRGLARGLGRQDSLATGVRSIARLHIFFDPSAPTEAGPSTLTFLRG
jgi:CheY-like chemotaxis protein